MKDLTPLFDADGFLLQPYWWDESLARTIAARDGVGDLGREHLAVLRTLREQFLNHQVLCPAPWVCRANGLDRHCLDRMFRGPREAWRIAGLPDPGEEAKSYL